VPIEAWQTITMDFIEGLPYSGSVECILVVVDKFTRYAHFIPLSHPAQSVAATFMSVVYKLHGLPASIISLLYLIGTLWSLVSFGKGCLSCQEPVLS
jgi:hypothetical protein